MSASPDMAILRLVEADGAKLRLISVMADGAGVGGARVAQPYQAHEQARRHVQRYLGQPLAEHVLRRVRQRASHASPCDISAWLAPEEIARWLGDGPFAIPLAVLIGVPVYINGLATVPMVAGLVRLGMSPAAGLAFMLATSATGFAAMTAVWALVRPRVFALYLAFAVSGALLAGYGYAAIRALV